MLNQPEYLTCISPLIVIETDDLEKVERTVFNNAGISRNLFNADGNLAVTNAILTDEASIRELPL